MAAPHSSRYPRPLRATHALAPSAAGASGIAASSQPARRYQAVSPSSPGPQALSVKKMQSPDSPGARGSERVGVLVPLESGDDELDMRRRANSLNSLADCCYGNSPWQQGPPTNQPLVPEGEGVGDEQTTEDHNEPPFHVFSHKRSSSCSSADILKKQTSPVATPARRAVDVHTRKSIEGLNQEISSVLEGVEIISPHQPPDGHMAPIRELLNSVSHSSPQFTAHSSPSSPHPHSTPSPLALDTPTDLPDTPTGFPLPASPSLSNPSFARDPPDGIERCLTTDIKPLSAELIPIGPDKSKAKIVFQKSSAFLPTAVAINS